MVIPLLLVLALAAPGQPAKGKKRRKPTRAAVPVTAPASSFNPPPTPTPTPTPAAAAPTAVWPVAGRVLVRQGSCTRERVGMARQPLLPGTQIFQGDTLRTDAGARMRIMLTDGSAIDLGSGTMLVLQPTPAPAGKPVNRLRALLGQIWARIMPRAAGEPEFAVETINAVAGVRGTSLVVKVDSAGTTQVVTVTGSVQVTDNNGHQVTLGSMERTQARGAMPLAVTTVQAGDLTNLRAESTPRASLEHGSPEDRVAHAAAMHNEASASAPRDSAVASRPNALDRGTPAAPINAHPVLNIDPGARPPSSSIKITVHLQDPTP